MKIKNLVLTLAAVCGLFIASNASATCSNYATYVDGQVLTASSLNSLQTNYTNCVNAVLDGDTFTGAINLHSGSDINFFSDTGSTSKGSIDGVTGAAILAIKTPGVPVNLNITSSTTGITFECGYASCSATNPGFIYMPSVTVGDGTLFTITSDVTLTFTGAHWGHGTTGDITGGIIRAILANDNGTLRYCAALLGNRRTLLTTDTNATATNINLPEEVLCNTAVGSASNTAVEIGYVRADFDDTGGASEDLWTVQTGQGDVVTGKSADGLSQPCNPTFGGFSSAPTALDSHFSQIGQYIKFVYRRNASGNSNDTIFTMTAPIKARLVQTFPLPFPFDNGTTGANGGIQTAVDSQVLTLYKSAAASWTNSGSKHAEFEIFYRAGPAASFIE